MNASERNAFAQQHCGYYRAPAVALLKILDESGQPLSAREITVRTPYSLSTIRQALTLARRNGLVACEYGGPGRSPLWRLTPQAILP